MQKAIALSVAAGLISALFTLSILMGSLGAMILVYLAPLPIFAVGLSLGVPAGLIASGSGALTIALGASHIMPAIAFLLTTGLPVCLIVRQALLNRTRDDGSTEWYPPGQLLLWLAGYGFAVLCLVGLVAGFWVQDAYAEFTTMLEQMAEAERGTPMGPFFEFLAQPEASDALFRMLPGGTVASWMILMVINATLAQGALTAAGKARRPSPHMGALDLPSWASLLLIAALAVGSIMSGILGLVAISITLIGFAVFALAGLGILHAILLHRSARLPVLIGIYLSLVIFFWPIFFVAGLAVLEPWMGLKQRLAAVPPSGPSGGPPEQNT